MHHLFCSKGIIDAKCTAIEACEENARGRAIPVLRTHAEIIKYCVSVLSESLKTQEQNILQY